MHKPLRSKECHAKRTNVQGRRRKQNVAGGPEVGNVQKSENQKVSVIKVVVDEEWAV